MFQYALAHDANKLFVTLTKHDEMQINPIKNVFS
ncbi:hypothetical protein SAMN05444355_101404 [Flavobacterium frigoris]|uniref:Uncharacterized protein n=1 Tax=Flavobacterium frigoris TaxID=229204 RepID=A0A1H9DAA6_FLAFI|nr:hypothetical protein SAMN05444355_101404 [Flavobacterium frigoris]